MYVFYKDISLEKVFIYENYGRITQIFVIIDEKIWFV